MSETKDTQAGYKCEACETIWSEDGAPEFEVFYECGNCGTIFSRGDSYDGDSHRCPDCMKFSSKLYDKGCPECEEGEVVEITMTQDADGKWVEVVSNGQETTPSP